VTEREDKEDFHILPASARNSKKRCTSNLPPRRKAMLIQAKREPQHIARRD
jgi:hypothetical protein